MSEYVRLAEIRAREARLAASKAATSRKVETVTETELAAAFRQGGMNADDALVAARGRFPRPAGSLFEAFRVGGLSEVAARVAARGRHGLREAVTDGSGFFASDYAFAGDETDPASWKLVLVLQPGDGKLGAYDPDLVRAAATAISTPEWGAPQVEIPAADLDRVKQTIRGAWIQAGLPVGEIPPALDEAALRDAFGRLGLSEKAAAVAAAGRGRRYGR
jgi:hypothetical protein